MDALLSIPRFVIVLVIVRSMNCLARTLGSRFADAIYDNQTVDADHFSLSLSLSFARQMDRIDKSICVSDALRVSSIGVSRAITARGRFTCVLSASINLLRQSAI